MPPAKGQKRSKKPVSAELVVSDVELPAQPVPAPPKITSPTRKGRKSGAVELDPDLEVGPVTISPTKLAPHKRKAGRPSTVVDIDDDSSLDVPLSHSTKKQRVATPFPDLRADTTVIPAPASDDDEGSAKITPRRLRKPVQLTKAASAKKSTSSVVTGKKTSAALLNEVAEAAGDSSDELRETSPDIILCDELVTEARAPLPANASGYTSAGEESEEDDGISATALVRTQDKGKSKLKPGAVARTPTRASRRALPQTFEDDSLSERDVPELDLAQHKQPSTPSPARRVATTTATKKAIKASPSVKQKARKEKSNSAALYPSGFAVPADSDFDDQDLSFEPVDTELMPLALQDMKLRLDYTTLPELPYVEMHSTNQHGNDHKLEKYSVVWAALQAAEDPLCRRRFRKAVRFANSLPYINPARAAPSLVQREGDRLILANTDNSRKTAVFLTTGVLAECQLVTPGYYGSSSTYLSRRITICPLHVEHMRTAAYIGHSLGREFILGPLYNGNLSFSTRKDAGSSASSPSTPSRPGRSALQFRKKVTIGHYPASLGFNEPVPIYDARGKSDFLFTAENMAALSALPLYTKNGVAADPPPYSLVTVGYAANEFTYTVNTAGLHGQPVASLNVLFAIVIGDVDRSRLDDLAKRMHTDV